MNRNFVILYGIVCFVTESYASQNNLNKENIDDYIDMQLEYAINELDTTMHIAAHDTETSVAFEPSEAHVVPLNYSYTAAKMVSLFGKLYVAFGFDFYQISVANNAFEFNKTMQFAHSSLFVKGADYNNLEIILLSCSSGVSDIYVGPKLLQNWILIQSIQSEWNITDSSLFLLDGYLYLTITTSGDLMSSGSFEILKWNGAHFDEIHKVRTNRPSNLISLQNQQSGIIMFLENSLDVRTQHNIVVYELVEDRLEKLQLVRARTSDKIVSYSYRNTTYVIIFSAKQNSTLYSWKDSELVPVKSFDAYEGITNILVDHIRDTVILFLVQKKSLLIFAHLSNELQLLYKSNTFEDYRAVLDITVIRNMDAYSLLVFTQMCDNKIGYFIMPFKIHVVEVDIKVQDSYELLKCLKDLEKHTKTLKNRLSSILQNRNGTLDGSHTRRSRASIPSENGEDSVEFKEDVLWITKNVDNMQQRVSALNSKVDLLYRNGEQLNGKTIVYGKLIGQKLLAKKLQINYLNNKLWNPHAWLSYTKPQIVTGQFNISSLNATHLRMPKDNFLTDILRRNEYQNITGKFTVQTLIAAKLNVPSLNDIMFEDFYIKSRDEVIEDTKTLSNFSINHITYSNQTYSLGEFQKLFYNTSSRLEIIGNLHIDNLYIDEINNVNMSEFQNNVFRVGLDKEIIGDLTLNNSVKIQHLFTESISNINTTALLTTSTNQTVASNIKFANVIAPNVNCDTINSVGMDDIVSSQNLEVKGPVTIDILQVAKNLDMNGSIDAFEYEDDHIVGTKESDLLQIYDKHVKIHGNLYLTNIRTASKAKVVIDNKPFVEEDVQNYWLKSHDQILPVQIKPIRGVSTSHLTVKSLNNVGLDNYLLNSLDDKLPTNIIFENITISGDVLLNESLPNSPNLQYIDTISVKTSGSFNIIGSILSVGNFSVGNLVTTYLDAVDLSEVVTPETNNKITGLKTFDTMVVNGNLASKNIAAQLVNNINLQTIVESALYLDKPEHLEKLSFNSINVNNLEVENINTVNALNYLKVLDEVHQLSTIQNLLVNGNVSLENVQNVLLVNNHNLIDVLNKLIDPQANLPIKNTVRFLGNVNVENIEVTTVNNVHFPSLVNRLFYRSWVQNVSAPFTFEKIITPDLVVPQINNVPTTKLINTKEIKPQNLLVWGGLQLKNSKFLKSLSAEKLSCDLNQALYSLKSFPTRSWSIIQVSQNATFWDKSCDLYNIFNNVVILGRNNIITGKVLMENDMLVNYLRLNNYINGINMNFLLNDAVLKSGGQQVISGCKTFDSLTVSNAVVEYNANVPIVNGIIIEKLNQSIIFKNNINQVLIKGTKTFYSGLQLNHLLVPSILGFPPNNLVDLSNLMIIPEAYFHSLEVGDSLNVDYVNNISLPYLIEQRLLCCTNIKQNLEGTYYFDTLILDGETSVSILNKLATDQLVFDNEAKPVVLSQKTFIKDLDLLGDVYIKLLNGENLSERYEQAVKYGEKSVIRGNVIFNNATLVTANMGTEYLNGVSITYIDDLMDSKLPISKIKGVYNLMSEIQNLIGECTNASIDMPKTLLYFEKSKDLQLHIPNAVDVRSLQLQDNVLFQITQNRPGSSCRLNDRCTCRIQKDIQISETQSINTIAEVEGIRVFSYENGNMSIHLFSNSVSYNKLCQLDYALAQNESAILQWKLYSKNKTSSSYYFENFVSGYISDVEFFTLKDNTYMIVCRFYHAIQSTMDLDCGVYKFISNEGRVRQIQAIRTKEAWTVHIFPTAQGMVLVIGSTKSAGKLINESGSGIYRFNAATEIFTPMRWFNNIVTSATGIVVQASSLVAVSDKKSVKLFKYHPTYNNYYYYQRLYFEYSVTAVSTFYSGDFGISDVYLCVVTEDGIFYIYSYEFIQGFKLVSKGEIDDLRILAPFTLNGRQYILTLSDAHTFLISAVVHGLN